jgi:hypothetical protein
MGLYGTTLVSGFMCGACTKIYDAETVADACCRCGDCGGKFFHESQFTSTCDGCAWGRRVRDARARLRRAKDDVVSAERGVAELFKGRPAKSAVKSVPRRSYRSSTANYGATGTATLAAVKPDAE